MWCSLEIDLNNDNYTWHLEESAGLSGDHKVQIGKLQDQKRFGFFFAAAADLACSSLTFANISEILSGIPLLFLTGIRQNQGMLWRETSWIKHVYPLF